MAHVITGDQIDKFRLRVIASALRLEAKGLRASRFSASKAARQVLANAGIKPKTKKVELLEQYTNYINSIETMQ